MRRSIHGVRLCMVPLSRAIVLVAFALGSAGTQADPWLAPGNLTLRHDLELLADAGIIRTPMTSWPISWPDVARDVNAQTVAPERSADIEQALARVRRAARAAASAGFSGLAFTAAAAAEPIRLRSFADTPREEGEFGVGASWLGERWAAAVRLTAVANPADDRRLRADGSYIGVSLANFMISFGATERWWGPGWDSSLILSTNARPIPGFTIERNYSDASTWPVLRWFGPWRASIAVGQTEGSDVAVADTRVLAARVAFKPRPWLELGLSRTAQ
ncbi:MAG: capsule assembly Wzi family protein, partial [Steroidobacteraceae bacterium]|nr:capsule assembly Wzi family protein [Steroidobacteraceae bacterium]